MICRGMLWRGMLCCGMLCRGMLCRRGMMCHDMSWNVVECYAEFKNFKTKRWWHPAESNKFETERSRAFQSVPEFLNSG